MSFSPESPTTHFKEEEMETSTPLDETVASLEEIKVEHLPLNLDFPPTPNPISYPFLTISSIPSTIEQGLQLDIHRPIDLQELEINNTIQALYRTNVWETEMQYIVYSVSTPAQGAICETISNTRRHNNKIKNLQVDTMNLKVQNKWLWQRTEQQQLYINTLNTNITHVTAWANEYWMTTALKTVPKLEALIV